MRRSGRDGELPDLFLFVGLRSAVCAASMSAISASAVSAMMSNRHTAQTVQQMPEPTIIEPKWLRTIIAWVFSWRSTLGRTWIGHASNPQSAPYQSWIDPASILDRPWIGPGTTLDRSWIDPGSNLDRPWIDPGSTRDRPWIDPGSALDRPWIDTGSTWHRHWIDSGSILDRL